MIQELSVKDSTIIEIEDLLMNFKLDILINESMSNLTDQDQDLVEPETLLLFEALADIEAAGYKFRRAVRALENKNNNTL